MSLQASETLTELRTRRLELASVRHKYNEILDAASNETNLILVLLSAGVFCLISAIVVWLAPLIDGRQLTGIVVIVLLMAGVFLFAFSFTQYRVENHKRLLRRELKAELAAAQELDATLRDKEQKLAIAIENEVKAGYSDAR